ncbi:MAG: hypothetical protein V3T17_04035 [Pseudomonadales bacterium]
MVVSQATRWFSLSFNPLAKQTIQIEGLLVSHDVESRPSEFVRQRFGCQGGILLCAFALIKLVCCFVVANDAVGGFHKGPGQIFVTVFSVEVAEAIETWRNSCQIDTVLV